jgi:hypothetical protein
MNRDQDTGTEEIRRRLYVDATELYGDDRARELAEQIDHLAQMMSTVLRQTLDLRRAPLGKSTRQYGSGR